MSRRFQCAVVSYNILTPPYADKATYLKAKPEHLDGSSRFLKIKTKLEAHMKEDAIITLQEVSLDWFSQLFSWFDSRGYTLIGRNYDGYRSGYMGVALAFPREKYSLVAADVKRCSDTRKWNRKPVVQAGLFHRFVTGLFAPILSLAGMITNFFIQKREEPASFDIWEMAQRRENAIVSVILKPKSDLFDRPFLVSTYHMPCVFWSHPFMTIHAAMALQHVQKLAKENGSIPYVLTGDFNFQPTSPTYTFVTNGSIDSIAQQHRPISPPHDPNLVESLNLERPVSSALRVFSGAEPAYTNLVITSKERSGAEPSEEFRGCLDYIFISDHWQVSNAGVEIALPNEYQPNAQEPSDHNLIHALLTL